MRRRSISMQSGERMSSRWMPAKLGAIQVPINTAYKGEFLRHQLADSGAKVFVVQGDFASRAVEILRGGQSKVVKKYSYDGLPHYGAWSHLTAPTVLERVDALLAAGTLRSTGGRFPKLEVA